jgi:hypothetical protein
MTAYIYTLPAHSRPALTRLVDAPLARVEGIHREWGLF